MFRCKKNKCALSLIYPNVESATYACDEKCYFSYCNEKTKEFYIKKYSEEMGICTFIKLKRK
jgi:hypothetical protein